MIGNSSYHKGILIFFSLLMSNAAFTQDSKVYQDPENAIYQYAVPIETRTAYLWIPPRCKQVRGVIISLANLLERNWLEDSLIRKTAADEGLGIIWVSSADKAAGKDQVFTADMKIGAGDLLLKMLKDFADVSGYGELEYAPIIAMGHSANGQFAWDVPNWDAGRTIAAIPIKTMPLPASLNFKDVPLCYVVGETTEWPQYRVPDPATKPGDRDFFWPVVRSSAVALREQDANNLVSVVTDAGGGHFDWSNNIAKFVSLFIHKACKYRLPKNQPKDRPVTLNKIYPQSGWLTDTGGMAADKLSPAPYASYMGDPQHAYWFFDRETALAAAAFSGDRKPRKKEMLTFVQDGKPLPVAHLGFASLKFEPLADGISFNLEGAFLTELPPELIGFGTKLGHAPGPIMFRVVSGPAIQTGPDEFRVKYNRGDFGGAVWIQEYHAGNSKYRHAVQPGQLIIPSKLTEGKPQSITFAPIADFKYTEGGEVNLKAMADSGLPVQYYVVQGPAIIVDDKLLVRQLPVNTKYPVKITIVAYQFGRVINPLYQSAAPVTQSFYIYK